MKNLKETVTNLPEVCVFLCLYMHEPLHVVVKYLLSEMRISKLKGTGSRDRIQIFGQKYLVIGLNKTCTGL
jgi:hypothetical protein